VTITDPILHKNFIMLVIISGFIELIVYLGGKKPGRKSGLPNISPTNASEKN
tara:strand:- start:193 stop:348 length:156 start_codon:yes stop_codon:yes gene_type:complete